MTMAESEVRASGKTAEEEVIAEIVKTADELPDPELPDERARKFRFPGFSRMRTEWYGEDGLTMRRVEARVDEVINNTFHDLFAIRHELYELVRIPEVDSDGAIREDRFGWTIWRKTSTGNYEEDWNQLGHEQQKRFLFLITTRIFEWEEKMDRMWAEAMFAKTQWEEAFSTGWQNCETGKKTEGDRTASGRLESQGERYFAIYLTYLSRRAESLVRGMERLAQRIKDVHTA
jgi:hypothetical protein